MRVVIMQSFRDLLMEGRLFKAIVDGLTSAIPLPLVALLVFGSIGMSYYLVQQRIIIPLIMMVLIGGVTIGRAPTGYASGILGVLVLALAGIAYVLLQRVSTQ